jgi:NAD(P)-dependent dehydrogenase (short-subunit alcohol dehydrogenase family)
LRQNDAFSPGLTSRGIDASLVDLKRITAFSEPSMSDFKQLSRSVAGLTVLVTGAASGMGRATARVFAAEGAKVAVTDFVAGGAEAVAAEIVKNGGTAKAWTLDVANRDNINAVVGEIAAHFGGLDIIVNNAGISVATPIDGDGYDAAWEKSIAVLLTAHPRIIRAAPALFAQIPQPAHRQYRLDRSARRDRIAQPLFGGQSRRGGLDAFARCRTRPRRHHRELHLSRPDHHRHDVADQ